MNYESNCLFIGESAFHIILKGTMAWSKVGERAIIETAISPFGIVNVKVRRPYEIPSKKRKLPDKAQASSSQAVKTTGTVAGHYYFNFVASTIDVLDHREEFKDLYILMDNCPIHNSKDIARYVVNRGYCCVYLPPIKRFWSVVNSKLKIEKLVLIKTLSFKNF